MWSKEGDHDLVQILPFAHQLSLEQVHLGSWLPLICKDENKLAFLLELLQGPSEVEIAKHLVDILTPCPFCGG